MIYDGMSQNPTARARRVANKGGKKLMLSNEILNVISDAVHAINFCADSLVEKNSALFLSAMQLVLKILTRQDSNKLPCLPTSLTVM
ncbi:hypothetical protein N7513_007324 [Penicillium frequentans]|nr:hypothetical protein N7513_007324 [Penicillium glabrum]